MADLWAAALDPVNASVLLPALSREARGCFDRTFLLLPSPAPGLSDKSGEGQKQQQQQPPPPPPRALESFFPPAGPAAESSGSGRSRFALLPMPLDLSAASRVSSRTSGLGASSHRQGGANAEKTTDKPASRRPDKAAAGTGAGDGASWATPAAASRAASGIGSLVSDIKNNFGFGSSLHSFLGQK